MERDPRVEATAEAIAYLTAVYETPNQINNDLSNALFAEAYAKDEGASLLAGLLNVTGHLLAKVEKATGLTANEVLQDIARRQQRPIPPPGV